MGQFNSRDYLRETNMPQEMTDFAIRVVDEVMNAHRRYGRGGNSQATGAYLYDDQKICDDINRNFLSRYGGKWFCMAGPHAIFPELQRPQKFIYFEYSTGWSYGGQKYRIFIYSYDQGPSGSSAMATVTTMYPPSAPDAPPAYSEKGLSLH